MAYVDWKLQGPSVTACNCASGCPCQFNSLPTNGNCRASIAIRVDRGHFGDVDLAGVKVVLMVAWPGPIHLGNGEGMVVIDPSASETQRNAILTIVRGAETEPGATFFNVFAGMITKFHEPRLLPIQFEADVGGATARVSIPDFVGTDIHPIRNPVTGAAHRARLTLPKGFEYETAEFAASSVETGPASPIRLEWVDRHAHLNNLDIGPYGPVHGVAA